MANFEWTPSKASVLDICLKALLVLHLKLVVCYLYQWILLNPVEILFLPLNGILLVLGLAVYLTHRCKPLVAVQLPTKLVVLNRPELPVDVLAIVVGRLVAIVYIECVLKSVVSPLAFALANLDVVEVDVRVDNAGTLSVVVEQGSCSLVHLALVVHCLNRLKTRTVQVEQFKRLCVHFLCLLLGTGIKRHQHAKNQIDDQKCSFHYLIV